MNSITQNHRDEELLSNEKQVLFDILNGYMKEENNQKVVIECINTLLKKYPNEYLEKPTLLTGEQYETMA